MHVMVGTVLNETVAKYSAQTVPAVSGEADVGGGRAISPTDLLISPCVRSVRSFVLCGQGSSLLWTQALRAYSGPVRLPRERKGIGRCVWCMLASVG